MRITKPDEFKEEIITIDTGQIQYKVIWNTNDMQIVWAYSRSQAFYKASEGAKLLKNDPLKEAKIISCEVM